MAYLFETEGKNVVIKQITIIVVLSLVTSCATTFSRDFNNKMGAEANFQDFLNTSNFSPIMSSIKPSENSIPISKQSNTENKFVTIRINNITLNIPDYFYIITRNEHTEGIEFSSIKVPEKDVYKFLDDQNLYLMCFSENELITGSIMNINLEIVDIVGDSVNEKAKQDEIMNYYKDKIIFNYLGKTTYNDLEYYIYNSVYVSKFGTTKKYSVILNYFTWIKNQRIKFEILLLTDSEYFNLDQAQQYLFNFNITYISEMATNSKPGGMTVKIRENLLAKNNAM
jgi:hypothetical protein